jgi:hypothetical protein
MLQIISEDSPPYPAEIAFNNNAGAWLRGRQNKKN